MNGGGGGNSSSSRRSDSGKRKKDREPGEISSESEADEGAAAGSGELKKVEKKKRKFSPIIWDRDEAGKKLTPVKPKSSAVELNKLTALPAPVSHSCSSSILPDLEPDQGSERPPSVEKVHAGLPQLLPEVFDQEKEALDDDYMSIPAIRASRWANDESPADEGEIIEDDQGKRSGSSRSGSSDAQIRSSGSRSDRPCAAAFNSNSDTEYDKKDETALTPKSDVSPLRTLNMIQGCRIVDVYKKREKIGEGTYGLVYRAKDTTTGEDVAIKKVKMEREREGVPLTALREINILLSLHHPSIVGVKEVVFGRELEEIYMVMEYMKYDLKSFMTARKRRFSESEVKLLMLQLLEGVAYLHDNWVMHRDLKPSNVLYNNGEAKICDFGMARQYGSISKPYTQFGGYFMVQST